MLLLLLTIHTVTSKWCLCFPFCDCTCICIYMHDSDIQIFIILFYFRLPPRIVLHIFIRYPSKSKGVSTKTG